MHSDTKKYNALLAPADRAICMLLAEQSERHLQRGGEQDMAGPSTRILRKQ